MKIRYLVAVAAALSFSANVFAADKPDVIFAASKCNACHMPAAKAVGPALKDIAAKYAGNKTAQATLEKKVRSGGAGSFGKMPMPATPATVSDANIKALVTWILSQK